MRLRLLFALSILLCTLAACAVPVPPTASSALAQKPLETPSPVFIQASPTHTVTAVPSPTVVPDTATPTITPTLPPTPIPTVTPTLPPTPTPTVTPTETPEATPTATYPPPPEEVHVPILMYHYISEVPPDADPYRIDLTVPPDRFVEQLDYLKTQGYQTIRLVDIYDILNTGKPLPENPIVLTFDDGYKDAYTNVLPLLQDYGFIAEFFVLATPAHFEAPAYLSWNDVRIMADSGMSMQPHGRDHYDLTNRTYEFLVYQILGAKEAVEAHSGKNVTFFCYPSGRYDDDTQAVVASAGYLGALTTEWGATQRLDNRYTWPRIRIKGTWTLDTFATIMASLKD
jgi:peptidoglycan/xylan/chitin deacetylase (PgdA/CDA1 family)